MGLILVILLVLLLVGTVPNVGPIPHNFGYGLPGILTVLVIILLLLLLTGRM